MTIWELLLIAVGLSMDAFAVSICKGLSVQRSTWGQAAVTGAFFGGFQAVMPLIGFILGRQFEQYITPIDHWIAFGLLGFIGVKMLLDARKNPEDECGCNANAFSVKEMIPLSIATSIDALAVGISFAFLRIDVIPAVTSIGVVTFIFSFFGVKLGSILGTKFQTKAQVVGGSILILMGTKILLEHLQLLPF